MNGFFPSHKGYPHVLPGDNPGTPSGFTALGAPQSPAKATAGARDLCAETNAQSVAGAGGTGEFVDVICVMDMLILSDLC